MDKRLIAALVVGVALVLITVFVSSNGGAGKAENKGNDDKQPITDIETNVDEKAPEVKDNKEDKDPEVIKKTKSMAHDFIKHYASLNPKKPMEYLSDVKDITKGDLYTKLENTQRRPTATSHKRVVTGLEVYPVEDVVPDRKKWNVIAIMDVYNSEGEKRKEETSYLVSVAKEDEWNVTGIKVVK